MAGTSVVKRRYLQSFDEYSKKLDRGERAAVIEPGDLRHSLTVRRRTRRGAASNFVRRIEEARKAKERSSRK